MKEDDEIIKKLEELINLHRVPDRDDYMDGIIDGLLMAIKIIEEDTWFGNFLGTFYKR